MHPPFFVVDHRIDHPVLPLEEHRVIRRSGPERLRMPSSSPGGPILYLSPVRPVTPVGRTIVDRIAQVLRTLRNRRGPVVQDDRR